MTTLPTPIITDNAGAAGVVVNATAMVPGAAEGIGAEHVFAAGTTDVSFVASDAAGNEAVACVAAVHVLRCPGPVMEETMRGRSP